jgi:multidrug efflux system outer membrane protein
MMQAIKFIPLVAALVLAGCAAPELHAPDMEVPSGYKEAAFDASKWKTAQPAEAQPRGEWWKAFNDDTLSRLIDDATKANQNLAAPASRGRQPRRGCGWPWWHRR